MRSISAAVTIFCGLLTTAATYASADGRHEARLLHLSVGRTLDLYGRLVKPDDIERYRGRWVAVDRTGEIVADAAELGLLLDKVAKANLSTSTVHRVPELDEPLFVGFG